MNLAQRPQEAYEIPARETDGDSWKKFRTMMDNCTMYENNADDDLKRRGYGRPESSVLKKQVVEYRRNTWNTDVGNSVLLERVGRKREVWADVEIFKPPPEVMASLLTERTGASALQVMANHTDVLGNGIFGPVLRGKMHGQSVAVKKIQTRADEQKLRHQLEAIESLSSPSVVTMYRWHKEADIQDGVSRFYLIMERCDGTLEEWLRTHGTACPAEQARQVSLQVCGGLAGLHRLGIPHRELRTSNILYIRHWPQKRDHEDRGMTPEEFTFKIGDFGLRHVLPEMAKGGAWWNYEKFNWTAPEVFKALKAGNQDYDPMLADVYSFGCVLYHIITKEKPWPGGQGRAPADWDPFDPSDPTRPRFDPFAKISQLLDNGYIPWTDYDQRPVSWPHEWGALRNISQQCMSWPRITSSAAKELLKAAPGPHP